VAGKKPPAERLRGLIDNTERLRRLVNKDLKQGYLRLGSEELLSDVSGFVSTRWTLLDVALGGGIPLGRIVELYGKHSAGKSTLVYQILSECQAQGGLPIYIDMERTLPRHLLPAFGIDPSRLFIVEREDVTLEKVFEIVETTLDRVREILPEGPVVIAWDTLAATPTEGEITGKPAKALSLYRAGIISNQARGKFRGSLATKRAALIVVNHETQKAQTGGFKSWGPQHTTPGGRSLKFYASARIRLREAEYVDDGDRKRIGRAVVAKVEKNKLGAPGGETKTRLYYGQYGRGFNDLWSLFDFLVEEDFIKRAGSWFKIPFPEGETTKFQRKTYLETVETTEGLEAYLRELATEVYKTRGVMG
jgi:recombination protein RecA